MTTLERFVPLRDLDRMERRMRRFFADTGFLPETLPPTDIYETEKEYVVELEVPGFDEKELTVEVTDHGLHVTGERTEETEKREPAMLLHERLERRFERRFELPRESDTAAVKAEYAKGVLTLHVPKTAAAVSHKVEIRSG